MSQPRVGLFILFCPLVRIRMASATSIRGLYKYPSRFHLSSVFASAGPLPTRSSRPSEFLRTRLEPATTRYRTSYWRSRDAPRRLIVDSELRGPHLGPANLRHCKHLCFSISYPQASFLDWGRVLTTSFLVGDDVGQVELVHLHKPVPESNQLRLSSRNRRRGHRHHRHLHLPVRLGLRR